MQHPIGRRASVCREIHYVDQCPRFKAMIPKKRWKIVKKQKVCFSCLKRSKGLRLPIVFGREASMIRDALAEELCLESKPVTILIAPVGKTEHELNTKLYKVSN